jgi:tetratricopeptide (TPR) repeat protein
VQRWDLLLRARWHFWRSSREHVRTAAGLLKQLLASNPNDAAALSLLAFTHLSTTWAGWAHDARAELSEANRLALKAVSLDEHDAHAHFTLGTALSCVGHMERGIAELERAMDIYPQFAAAAGELGRQLAFSGRTQEAEEYVLRAMDASPQDPHVSLWVRSRAIAAFIDERYAEAVRYAYDAAARRPDWFFNHFLLAACLAAAGDVASAQLSMAEAEKSHPYPWGAMRVGHPFVRDADRIRFLDALALAGWNPDQRR